MPLSIQYYQIIELMAGIILGIIYSGRMHVLAARMHLGLKRTSLLEYQYCRIMRWKACASFSDGMELGWNTEAS